MLEKLRRFSALEPPAQKQFLYALAMLPVISLSLRWNGFRATQETLQKLLSPRSEQDSAVPTNNVARTAHMVHAADRYGLIHPSCLAKSLTLWWLLGRQGISSRVRIGIRKENGKLEAHAWVEREGIALNEPEERHHHYAAFDAAFSSLPAEES